MHPSQMSSTFGFAFNSILIFKYKENTFFQDDYLTMLKISWFMKMISMNETLVPIGFCWASSRRHAEAPCEQHRLYHQHQNITVAQWGNSHQIVYIFEKKSSNKNWFQDLKTQIGLLGTNQDLYKEAADAGRLTEDLNMKVDNHDICSNDQNH